jgi:hypothetical protein
MEKWNSCSKPPTSSWKSVRSRLDLDRFCGDLRFEQTWGTGCTQNSTRLKRSNLHNLQRFSPTFVRQKPKSPMVTLHVKSQVSECHDKSWTAKSKRKTSWSNVRFVNYRVVHPYTPSYFHWFIDLCSLHSVVRYSPPKKKQTWSWNQEGFASCQLDKPKLLASAASHRNAQHGSFRISDHRLEGKRRKP